MGCSYYECPKCAAMHRGGQFGRIAMCAECDPLSLTAVNADLLAALEAVEWQGTACNLQGDMFAACPCCDNGAHEGHKTDCRLAAALRRARGEEGGQP